MLCAWRTCRGDGRPKVVRGTPAAPPHATCATPPEHRHHGSPARAHAMSSGSRPPWVGPEDPSVNDQLRQEYAARGQSTTTLRLAADSVEAYLEYERVVGGQDGGELLTDEQYALFRQTALERSANRLYVTWRNSDGTGLDCKAVGPATLCECGHRYKEHTRLADQARELRCRAPGCACASYQYLPSAGAWHAKCGCKHGAVRGSALAVLTDRKTLTFMLCHPGAARRRHQDVHAVRLRSSSRHLQLRLRPAVGPAPHGRRNAAAAHGGGAPGGQPGRRRGGVGVCCAGRHHGLLEPDRWYDSCMDGRMDECCGQRTHCLAASIHAHQAMRLCSGARCCRSLAVRSLWRARRQRMP